MAYTGNLKSKIKDPLYKSIEMYKENSTDSKVVALANAWNTIQKEVKLNWNLRYILTFKAKMLWGGNGTRLDEHHRTILESKQKQQTSRMLYMEES